MKASAASEPIVFDNVGRTVVQPSPRFRQVLSESPTAVSNLLSASSSRFQKLVVGSSLEVSPVAFKVARKIGEILHSKQGGGENVMGCALIVDYGGDHSFGDSFRVGLLKDPVVLIC